MCAIAGIINCKEETKSLEINEMCQQMILRDPDHVGTYCGDNIALGHCRLSIIDLESGNQPMFTPDGSIVIVFNGEIYNYIELKKELAGTYHFKTLSDTEVLLAGYVVWGIDKVFWYKSRSREIDKNDIEDHYGLWHKDYTLKPAFFTYEALTKLCPDKSTRPKLVRFHNVYMASWKRPDRKKVWALWTSEKNETVSLRIKGRYKMFNDHGVEIYNRTSSETMITPSVLYIVGAKELLFE